MKNVFGRNSFVLLWAFFSASVFGEAKCLSVQGTVDTQSQNLSVGIPDINAEQVGVITMFPTLGNGNLFAFQKAFGKVLLTGGIHGTITDVTFTNGIPTNVILDHEIGFPGVGSLISIGDTASFIGLPDAEGNIPVQESGTVEGTESGGGAFTGLSGDLVATGMLGMVSGTNSFTYTGKLCWK